MVQIPCTHHRGNVKQKSIRLKDQVLTSRVIGRAKRFGEYFRASFRSKVQPGKRVANQTGKAEMTDIPH